MLIEPGQVIGGFDAVVLRSWMKALQSTQSAGVFAEECALPRQEAERLVEPLCDAGLVEQVNQGGYSLVDEPADVAMWTTTVAGNAVAKARIGKRMPLTKAEVMLDAVRARVREYNADEKRFYDIELKCSAASPEATNRSAMSTAERWPSDGLMRSSSTVAESKPCGH